MKKPTPPDTPGMHHGALPPVFRFAHENRYRPTEAETTLWAALKNNQLGGNRFRRQHPVHVFVLDFYCHRQKLCVELDGGYHDHPDQKARDEYRTAELRRLGIREIRFRNEEVLEDLEKVLARIREVLCEPPPPGPPTPDPLKGEYFPG